MRLSRTIEVSLLIGVFFLLGVVGESKVSLAQTTCSNATPYRGQNGQQITCVCPANFGLTTIWGTGIYTDDSNICTAALHAGLITQASGGTVTIEIRPGQSSYTSSSQNGVTSTAYGSWATNSSFVFVGSTPPQQTNRPPNAPTLLSPPNSNSPAISPSSITLQWQNNGDPDGDPIYFEVQIYIYNTSSRQWQYTYRNTVNGTYITLPPWTPNAYYVWRVFAIDGNKRSNPWYTVSGWSSFYTSP
jgi:hypothetical protein